MVYLTKDDLIVLAYERFIDESSQDQENILADTEKRAIAYLKTVLGTRYNVNALFDENEPIINQLIVDILSKIVLYNIIRRNAPRKLSTDFKEDYDAAMKLLKDIATGVVVLDGVPLPTDENGQTISQTIFGNNTNKNYYI